MSENILMADAPSSVAEPAAYHGSSFRIPNPSRPVDAPSKPASPAAPSNPPTPPKPSTPKPDAPLTKVGRMLIAGVHAAVLLGLVLFVAVQVVRIWTAPNRRAVVTVVAPHLQEIASPVDGTFHAIRPLYKGTRVRKGEFIGTVESTVHTAEREALENRLAMLGRLRLVLGSRGASGADQGQAIRDVCERIEAVQGQLAVLSAVEQKMRITSPVTGKIAHSRSGNSSVRKHENVASIWTEDDELLIEVEAPLDVIRRLVSEETFPVQFQHGEQRHRVSVRAMASTLQPVDGGVHAQPNEQWAVIHCQPQQLPEAIAFPGAMGSL